MTTLVTRQSARIYVALLALVESLLLTLCSEVEITRTLSSVTNTLTYTSVKVNIPAVAVTLVVSAGRVGVVRVSTACRLWSGPPFWCGRLS